MGLRDFLPRDFFLGTGTDKNELLRFPQLADRIAENFNCLIPVNSMKWNQVVNASTLNLEPLDWMVSFCQANNLTLRGHGLFSRMDRRSRLLVESPPEVVKERHSNFIEQIFTRYRGIIPFYDVAVEFVNDDGTLREHPWFEKIGKDFLGKTFACAQHHDPNTQLFYSDMRLHIPAKAAGLFKLIESIRNQGATVHGISIQLHHNISGAIKLLWLRRLIRQAFREGLNVHIPEATIWNNFAISENAAAIAQAYLYQKILEVCLEEGVEFFGVWSCCDRHVWRFPDKTPGLWDEDYQPKKAVLEIQRTLQKNFKPSPSE